MADKLAGGGIQIASSEVIQPRLLVKLPSRKAESEVNAGVGLARDVAETVKREVIDVRPRRVNHIPHGALMVAQRIQNVARVVFLGDRAIDKRTVKGSLRNCTALVSHQGNVDAVVQIAFGLPVRGAPNAAIDRVVGVFRLPSLVARTV